jgi:isochorismate pyruvate lyase
MDSPNVYVFSGFFDFMNLKVERAPSHTPWGEKFGYSRAIRVGNQIFISGTAPSDEKGNVVATGDAYAQTKFVIEKIERALVELGSSLSHVVIVRMYVTDISKVEEVGRAYSEHFSKTKPCFTLIEISRLVNPEMIVEAEVEAVVP